MLVYYFSIINITNKEEEPAYSEFHSFGHRRVVLACFGTFFCFSVLLCVHGVFLPGAEPELFQHTDL